MSQTRIYRKAISHGAASEEDLKYMIKVIRPVYWLILLGGVIIIGAAVFWMFMGSNTATTSIVGVYHPGSSDYGEVICFPSISSGKQLDVGMEAKVEVSAFSQSKYGHIDGEITYTEEYIASQEEMYMLLEDQSLTASFYQNAPATCIIVKLSKDPTSASGYLWNNKRGKDVEIKDGMMVNVSVVTNVERSFSLFDFKNKGLKN